MRLLAPILLLVALAGCGDSERDASSPPPSTSPVTTTGSTSPGASTAAAGASSVDQPNASPTTPAGGPLRLGVLGDSYSNGEAVGLDRAWPTVMAGLLTRGGLPVTVVANPSVTGATTAEMLDTGLPPIRASRPDVMTVMLGVNDQVQGRSLAQFAADEDRALAAAIEITGSARRVIAVDIPDYSGAPVGSQFGDPSAISGQIDAFNREIRDAAARRDVRVVSIVDISRRRGAAGISDDGLHPTADQLAEWAARIAAVARDRWADLPDTED